MTPEFLSFKHDLINALVHAVDQHPSLVLKLGDNGNEPDAKSAFVIYVADQQEVGIADDSWLGRYVSVELNDEVGFPYKLCFMQTMPEIKKDYGGSAPIPSATPNAVKAIVDYLVNGTLPVLAMKQH